MDTLILFALTTIAWFALEFWRVLRGQQSISGQVWQLHKDWPPLGWLAGLLVGTLGAHFFFGQCGP